MDQGAAQSKKNPLLCDWQMLTAGHAAQLTRRLSCSQLCKSSCFLASASSDERYEPQIAIDAFALRRINETMITKSHVNPVFNILEASSSGAY